MKGISISQQIINNAVDDNYKPLPQIDAKYGPYPNIPAALAALPDSLRAIGLTIGIRLSDNTVAEYWFNGGIADENLLVKKANDVPVDTVYVQDTPPSNPNGLWVDLNFNTIGLGKDDILYSIVQSIKEINYYINTIVKQRDLIINPGHVSNTFTDSALQGTTPINPNTRTVDINFVPITSEEAPNTDPYEPNTKAVRAHYGTIAEIQANFKKFVDYELIIASDTKKLYTKINGEPVMLSGSSGGPGGGSIDYEALDALNTIGFIAPNKQVWRVKVDNDGKLIVYKKELDIPQAEPAGGQTDPSTGWVYVTTLYLQKLYINSIYCGGITATEYDFNPCSHNFVELSNLTNADISLNGLSLQYGTEGHDWEVLPLWGTIKAGSTFLVRGAQCAVMNTNTTKIKVDDYDMEWIAKDGNLIKFDNRKAKFYLTWGTEPCSVANPYNNTTTPIRLAKGYIDLVGLQIQNAGDADKVDASEAAPYGYLSSKYLFTKYYSMDGVNQATKALTARSNANDMYFVNLEEVIVPNVEHYTPKASKQNKNIFYNKTLLDPNKPNKVTMTLGINGTITNIIPSATRCFNWVSVGYYDEYLWYRPVSIDPNAPWTKVESFKHETGIRKYYNRIRAITTDGTVFTSHKVILKNLTNNAYEFYVGRDDNYKSSILTFNIVAYGDYSGYSFYQITDQQGFNKDEYNVWNISAKYIASDIMNSIAGRVEFIINTGDMTQNGNRINEWLDYDEGYKNINRKFLADKDNPIAFTTIFPEMVTVGNNDLTPVDFRILGDGGDNSKINATNIRFFYCFEMDENNPPIFNIEGKEIYIDSLYSFDYGDVHYLCVNSEISSNTERDVYGLSTTGVVYDYIRQWCERDAANTTKTKRIAFCHEMPFTIITQNLINSFFWNGVEYPEVERSGARLNFNTSNENKYWFSKFLQTHGYKLCIGGHKHTYSCSHPILENPDCSMKPIIQVTAATLLSDFGSTELYTETSNPLLNGQKFPKTWENNPNYDMVKHLCTFELVTAITAPVYIMCQATGYKHTSNKELPSPNTPWLKYFFPANITINSKTDVVAKVNAGQRYPFYITYNIGADEDGRNFGVSARVKKLDRVFDATGKYNINIQGLNPTPIAIGGNGQQNNGNDIINIKL